MAPVASAHIAYCPEHGLHGERPDCFVCGGPVEQVLMVPANANATYFLQRAVAAEDRAEKAEAHVAKLKGAVSAALSMDPTTATQALSWIGRAENAEGLVRRVLAHVRQRSLASTDLPPGWVTQAEAQMKSVEILARDHAELAERPAQGDAYWATGVDEKGRTLAQRLGRDEV